MRQLSPHEEMVHTMDTKENSAENVLGKFSSYILASASPRRIAMMRQHGIEPLVCPAEIEETLPPRHDMYETVMFLALKKAKWVESEYLQQACHRQEGGSHQTRDAKLVVCADAPEHAVPTAAYNHVNALSMISISDNFVTGAKSSVEERQNSFTNMMKLALETAVK